MPQDKLPISAVVITKNEERNIEDCLRSVEFCDEIVVVDSFSDDRTVEIARRYTERVEQRRWNGINEQREYAKGLASNEWVLDLDADERISPELAAEIAGLDLGAAFARRLRNAALRVLSGALDQARRLVSRSQDAPVPQGQGAFHRQRPA